jgi:hypothetical protein
MHLCTCVSEEGGDGEDSRSETPSLLSYTLRYVSFAVVDSICRVAWREQIHLCTSVSEEGGRRHTGKVVVQYQSHVCQNQIDFSIFCD